MHVLIAAGGTIAPIDDVRLLTNRSTGRFASALAEACLARSGAVTYLATTPQTHGPLEEPKQQFGSEVDPSEIRQRLVARMAQGWNHRDRLRRIDLTTGTVSDYAQQLEQLARSRPWDIVLLASAVSDYEPVPMSGKISSDAEELVITLKRTPKVIRQVRDWVGPDTTLVGFKLTSGASDQSMIEIAHQACLKNRSDFTIVNDQSSLSANRHRVGLVTPDASAQWFEPGDQMADQVIETLFQRIASQRNG
jgi:phosphopantothenate-cysteine ligase